MVIFHCYVSSPEGIWMLDRIGTTDTWEAPWGWPSSWFTSCSQGRRNSLNDHVDHVFLRYSESIQLMCETTDWCIVTNPKEDRTVICHHHVGFYINPSSKRGCHLYFPVAEFRAGFGHRHEISKGQRWWVHFFSKGPCRDDAEKDT